MSANLRASNSHPTSDPLDQDLRHPHPSHQTNPQVGAAHGTCPGRPAPRGSARHRTQEGCWRLEHGLCGTAVQLTREQRRGEQPIRASAAEASSCPQVRRPKQSVKAEAAQCCPVPTGEPGGASHGLGDAESALWRPSLSRPLSGSRAGDEGHSKWHKYKRSH